MEPVPPAEMAESQAAANAVTEGGFEVSLGELRGLSDTEQFLRVYGAPRIGTELWEQWHRMANPTTQAVIAHLAEQNAEQDGVSLDEARRHLAAEKLMNDVGPEGVARMLQSMREIQFAAIRTLQPMVPRPKKKPKRK